MFSRAKIIMIYFCCVCLLGGILLINGVALANTPNKKRIAVVDFENHSRYKEAGHGIADLLTVELVKNGNFEVIERKKLQQVFQEQWLGASGAVTEESAAKLGELLGLDYLVFGSVTNITETKSKDFFGIVTEKATATLSMRLVDATSGSIILADSAEASDASSTFASGPNSVIGTRNNGAVTKAATKAVIKLVNKIDAVNPLEGIVVKVIGNTIYIDLGSYHGVKTGQRYEIFLEGSAIIHPVTGKIIGVEKTQIGEIRITRVESRMAVGQAQNQFRDNMITVGNKVRRII